MGRKVIAVWLCLAMMLGFIVIVDVTMDFTLNVKGATLYVNTTGSGGAYTSIQDAINASNDGDTIFVYNGTYYENVVVNKSVTIIGNGSENSTIDSNGFGDTVLVTSDWVNITGFSVTNSGDEINNAGLNFQNVNNCSIFQNRIFLNSKNGIIVTDSNDINITQNNLTRNGFHGLRISSSLYINITNNIISRCDFAIHFIWSSYNIMIGNNISNCVRGVDLEYSKNITILDNKFYDTGIKIEGGELETFNSHTIPANNIINGKPVYYYKNQSNFSIDNIPIGEVILVNCSYVEVKNLQIIGSSVGIELAYSTNIIINRNYINSIGLIAIYLVNTHTKFNNITKNDVIDNNYGIRLVSSKDNNIIENNVTKHSYGIDLVANSNQNYVALNNVWDNGYGINLAGVKDNRIIGNIISDCYGHGIRITSSSHNNIIKGNNITINEMGINLEGTSNLIYHNNFINNINQASDSTNEGHPWNNVYPIGGNYWSDYIGVDKFKGPNQDIPGSDGIGDTNYTIDTDSIDHYPLMEPYKPLENYTILKQGWNLISIPLIQKEKNLTRVLGAMDGWYNSVQWHDKININGPWKHNKVGKPYGNDLFELNETMGFWIHITNPEDTIFLYNGTQPTSNLTIQLHKGWNMVGYPSLRSYNRTVGLNNLTFNTHVDAIWTYDAVTQKYKELTASDYFEIGKGYYIHAKEECTWVVPL
jgi:parallel beta-helix repeat protein